MARVALLETAFDSTDSPVARFLTDASVTVYKRGTEDEAVVYSAQTGGVVLDQPLRTDQGGRVLGQQGELGWVDEGAYDLAFASITLPWEKGGSSGGGGGAVESVNGEDGAVVIDAGDVGAATPAEVDAVVETLEVAGVGGVVAGTDPETDRDDRFGLNLWVVDGIDPENRGPNDPVFDLDTEPGEEEGGGAVSSVFGREGDVVAEPGDYAVADVTGAAAQADLEDEEAARAASDAAHAADTTSVHGIADTSALALKSEVATDAELAAHEADTTAVHGIADTSKLATKAEVEAKQDASTAATDTELAAEKSARETADGERVSKSLVDAKGDLLVGTADNTVARKAVGSNGKVLGAASGESDGLKWLDNNRIESHTFSVAAPTAAKLGGFFIAIASGETVTLLGVRYKTDSGTCKLKVKRTTSGGSTTEPVKEKEAKSEAQEQTPGTTLADKDYLSVEVESVSSPTFLVVTLFIERTR